MRLRAFLPIVFGCILIAPAFYNREAFDNGVSYLMVALGICLLLVGLNRLGDTHEDEPIADSLQTHNVPPRINREVSPQSGPSLLSRVFAMLGHFTLVATSLGLAYMMLFAPTGSASAVPVGIGLVLAAALYALSSMAKR